MGILLILLALGNAYQECWYIFPLKLIQVLKYIPQNKA